MVLEDRPPELCIAAHAVVDARVSDHAHRVDDVDLAALLQLRTPLVVLGTAPRGRFHDVPVGRVPLLLRETAVAHAHLPAALVPLDDGRVRIALLAHHTAAAFAVLSPVHE